MNEDTDIEHINDILKMRMKIMKLESNIEARKITMEIAQHQIDELKELANTKDKEIKKIKDTIRIYMSLKKLTEDNKSSDDIVMFNENKELESSEDKE